MDTQLKRGYLEICVLSAMARGETYGYQLLRDLKPVMEITESTLYPILRRLEVAGSLMVRTETHNNRQRKYYMLTEGGRKRIDEFLSDWKEVEKVVCFIRKCTKPNP